MAEKLPPELRALPNYHGETWHTLEGRSIREFIFGMNDGLITGYGFVSGVGGAHLSATIVFLTGLAQAAAGAISMYFGAYLSTKAQQEFFQREIDRETREIETDPQKETDEIREIYQARGFSKEEIEILVKRITSSKQSWLAFMIREELGLSSVTFDNPWKVAVFIGLSYLIGSLIPVVPYVFTHAVLVSSVCTLLALFAVGAGKTKLTKTPWFSGGLESLGVGVVAGGIGLGVGKLLALFQLR